MRLKLTLLICSLILLTSVSFAQHGGLDDSFGTNGIVVSDLGFDLERSRGMTIQSDGKILLVGSVDNGNNNDLILVRYNSNGVLDASFNGNGFTTVDLGGAVRGKSVAILPDGKILTAGTHGGAATQDFLIDKFNNKRTINIKKIV